MPPSSSSLRRHGKHGIDVPRINAIAEVGADMLRKIGMNVDQISTD